MKDPEHDGRLKENREAGKTKGTTEASAERAQGHASTSGSHTATSHGGGSHASDTPKNEAAHKSDTSEGGKDLKSREYTGKDGEVHHHTTKHG